VVFLGQQDYQEVVATTKVTLNALIKVYVTAPPVNALALLDMKVPPANVPSAQMHALDMELAVQTLILLLISVFAKQVNLELMPVSLRPHTSLRTRKLGILACNMDANVIKDTVVLTAH
jgi:hypothetical protein